MILGIRLVTWLVTWLVTYPVTKKTAAKQAIVRLVTLVTGLAYILHARVRARVIGGRFFGNQRNQ